MNTSIVARQGRMEQTSAPARDTPSRIESVCHITYVRRDLDSAGSNRYAHKEAHQAKTAAIHLTQFPRYWFSHFYYKSAFKSITFRPLEHHSCKENQNQTNKFLSCGNSMKKGICCPQFVSFVGFKLKEMKTAFRSSSATKHTHQNHSH